MLLTSLVTLDKQEQRQRSCNAPRLYHFDFKLRLVDCKDHRPAPSLTTTRRKPSNAMARKADDLLADLDQLGSEEQQAAQPSSNKAGAKNAKPSNATNDEEDALAEIEKQLAAKPAAGSRPGTPRMSSSTTSGTNRSPKRTAEYTPATTSVNSSERNSSEDRARANAPRASGEGNRSFHQAQTPAEDNTAAEPEQQQAAGGGWWGSMFSAATAAVKQAETLAKEIRGNEEAQKWADQVRGQYQNLQSIGVSHVQLCHLKCALLTCQQVPI